MGWRFFQQGIMELAVKTRYEKPTEDEAKVMAVAFSPRPRRVRDLVPKLTPQEAEARLAGLSTPSGDIQRLSIRESPDGKRSQRESGQPGSLRQPPTDLTP